MAHIARRVKLAANIELLEGARTTLLAAAESDGKVDADELIAYSVLIGASKRGIATLDEKERAARPPAGMALMRECAAIINPEEHTMYDELYFQMYMSNAAPSELAAYTSATNMGDLFDARAKIAAMREYDIDDPAGYLTPNIPGYLEDMRRRRDDMALAITERIASTGSKLRKTKPYDQRVHAALLVSRFKTREQQIAAVIRYVSWREVADSALL